MFEYVSASNKKLRRAPRAAQNFYACGVAMLALAFCPAAYSQEGVKTQASPPVTETKTNPSGDRDTVREFVRPRRTSAQPATDEAASETAKTPSAVAENSSSGGELEALRTQIEEAKSDGERARLRRALAERLTEAGRQAEAIAELKAMAREERFDPAGFYNVGNALARLGDSHSAAEAYRKAIQQRRGNYSRAQNNLGVVLTRLGRWDEAQEALSEALRLENLNYAEASYNLGRLHALRGEAGLAIREWQRTLAVDPDHTDAAVALARAYAEDGDPRQGLAVLDAFAARGNRLGRSSTPRPVVVTRGEIVAASNAAADEKKSDGKKAGAENVSVKTSGGGGVTTTRRNTAAPSPTLRTLAVDQESYSLLQRARAAREGSRHEEAVGFYRRVLARRGGYFPPANLELGYSLTTLRRNEEAVESFLPVAVKDGTRYPTVYYHLGRLYESLGQLRQASENYGRAAALMSDDSPQVLLDVSRVREKEGNIQAAIAALEAYVRASERLGGAPDWVAARLTTLRQKLSAPNLQGNVTRQ